MSDRQNTHWKRCFQNCRLARTSKAIIREQIDRYFHNKWRETLLSRKVKSTFYRGFTRRQIAQEEWCWENCIKRVYLNSRLKLRINYTLKNRRLE